MRGQGMSRNVITGGSGLLGVAMARAFLANGEAWFSSSTERSCRAAVDLTGRVEIATGDVGEWVHVLETIRRSRVDCIYHAAAILGSACEASAASSFRVNVMGTMNALEAARLLEVSNIMFVGSGTTFGTASVPAPVDDITRQRPENMYGTSKLCSELLKRQYHRQSGRCAMIVGPTRQITHHYGD